MISNLKRIIMVLKHAKRTTDYLLKLKSTNRKRQHLLIKATSLMFEVEKLLRDLQKIETEVTK